jgi:HSP20 family molecular chaperone IbpA
MSQSAMTNTQRSDGTNGAVARPYIRREVAPPVDVFENADEILLVADIPGVPSGEVDVRLENGTLTLKAERARGDAQTALAREYEEVSYARAFRIPAGIDTANIEAEARHGTVVVRLPKAANAKPRKIEVK